MNISKQFTITFTTLFIAKSIYPTGDLHTHNVYHMQNLPRPNIALITGGTTGISLILPAGNI
jgi:hypothetical protein